MSQRDPVIDEVRDIRHRISERFRHDPERLVAYYIELQEQYREQLIVAEEVPVVMQLKRRTRRSTGRVKSVARRST